MEGLQVGRIVHYVPASYEIGDRIVQHRAAMITNLISPDGVVNLMVFLDWSSDAPMSNGGPLYWAPSRAYGANAEPGTWHWPERI